MIRGNATLMRTLRLEFVCFFSYCGCAIIQCYRGSSAEQKLQPVTGGKAALLTLLAFVSLLLNSFQLHYVNYLHSEGSFCSLFGLLMMHVIHSRDVTE